MKTSRQTGPSAALLIVLSAVRAHAGLTCDLNAGSLNSLQIGRAADAKAVASALGTEPGFTDENFPGSKGYLFPGLGIEVLAFEDGAAETVATLAVYYTAGQDFYGAPVARYQGDFVPALDARETLDSIRKKLGVPAKEYLPAPGVSEPSLLLYRRPFGKMDFLFGVDGTLRHITLSKLGPGDEGWTAPPKKSEPPARVEPARQAPLPQNAPPSDAWAQKVVFPDGVPASAKAPLAARPWTEDEKREVLAVLADIRGREPGLTDRVTGYRPLTLYRAERIGTEAADALTDQRLHAIFLGGSFFEFNGAGKLRILTHELAHLADAFGRHSDDPAWRKLSTDARARVAEHLKGRGLSIRQAALAGMKANGEAALKEGFFSLWSCLSPSEALADAATDLSLGRSPRLPGADDFVRRKLLSPFSKDPWEEGMHAGSAAMERNDLDAAIAAFSAAADREPSLETAFLFRAEAWQKKGDPARVIEDFSSVLRLSPGNTQVRARRGDLYYARKDYDLAIADFSQVIAEDPANAATATLRRGKCWLGKGDLDEAVADLGAVLRLEPRNWTALGLFMEASFARGDHERVLADAQSILKLNPKNTFARQMRGRSLLATRRWEEAAAEFTELIGLDPGSADAYAWRAKAYEGSATAFNSGHNKAFDDYSTALSLSTPTAQLLYEKGAAARKCGMPHVAVNAFSQALTLDPERVDILVAQADAELQLWRQDKASNWHSSAQATIAQALRLAPQDEGVRTLAARIESETAAAGH